MTAALTASQVTGRCGPCRRLRHRDCTGRASGCACWACPGRYAGIVRDAQAIARSSFTEEHEARAMVGTLLGLLSQRYAREQGDARGARRRPQHCAECGGPLDPIPHGRHRITCSGTCRNKRYKRRAQGVPATSLPVLIERWQAAQRARGARDTARSAANSASLAPVSAAPDPARKTAPRPEPVPVPSPMPDFVTPVGSVLEKYLRTGRSW
jgi:hypothetical protein